MCKYTLTDFENITNAGFNYSLPSETVKKISVLSLEVGSPNYVKTPIFKKKDKPETVANSFAKKRKNKTQEILTDDDWEALRSFQATQIEEKTGLDKEIDNLRSQLNKLSDKNYDFIFNELNNIILKLMKERTPEELTRVSNIIFELSSSNRFYSKIYAAMYCELIKKYDFIKTTFNENNNTFLNIFTNIEYVDANVDYNLFCKINGENEKRKALSAFFVNLHQNKFVEYEFMLQVVTTLIAKAKSFMNESNKKNQVDELFENIFILLDKKMLTNESIVYDEIVLISKSKTTDFQSLTNKTIFKCMDILDL